MRNTPAPVPRIRAIITLIYNHFLKGELKYLRKEVITIMPVEITPTRPRKVIALPEKSKVSGVIILKRFKN
jgi:hypothetical protein